MSHPPPSGLTTELRCHRCSHYLGEAPEPVEFVGVVKAPDLRMLAPTPRWTIRCKCGWLNLWITAGRRAA